MQSPLQDAVIRAIELRLFYSMMLKDTQALFRLLLECLDFPKNDGIGRACLGAGWLHAILEPIIAERTFMSLVISFLVACNHPKRTGHHAITTTIADILLHIDCIKLGANDRPGRASFLTRRIRAMFTYIALH